MSVYVYTRKIWVVMSFGWYVYCLGVHFNQDECDVMIRCSSYTTRQKSQLITLSISSLLYKHYLFQILKTGQALSTLSFHK